MATQEVKAVDVLGVSIDAVSFAEAVERAVRFVRDSSPSPDMGGHHIITANPEMIMKASETDTSGRALKKALSAASLVVADGIGVVWASRVLGTPVPERIPGIDLAQAVLRVAARQGWRVFMVGAAPSVAEAAAQRLAENHQGLRVVGVHQGYFDEADSERVTQEIGAAQVDVLLVGMGIPKQEMWISTHRKILQARLMIGVGGAFDVFSGRLRRAPVIVQKMGLEWAYRLAREPRRIGRMAALPRFVTRVMRRQRNKE